MGTPEFPDLGKHCSAPDCNQLDFLPFACDVCHQVFCLEHRSYNKHDCPNAADRDVTVLVCPLCAKAVRLVPHEDPNLTFDRHVTTDCDPSNYEKVHKKPRCPARGCRESLTSINRMTCKHCHRIVCLKHRFGPDHDCKGPAKSVKDSPWYGSQIMQSFLRQGSQSSLPSSSSTPDSRKTGWDSATSVFRASAEAGLNKISTLTSNVLNSVGSSSSSQQQRAQSDSQSRPNSSGSRPNSSGYHKPLNSTGPKKSDGKELCPQCGARFATVSLLIQHVEAAHNTNKPLSVNDIVDLCPKCGKGFRDPVSLVNHVEIDHGGTSSRRK